MDKAGVLEPSTKPCQGSNRSSGWWGGTSKRFSIASDYLHGHRYYNSSQLADGLA